MRSITHGQAMPAIFRADTSRLGCRWCGADLGKAPRCKGDMIEEAPCGPPGHRHVHLPLWYLHDARLDLWQPRGRALTQRPGRRTRPRVSYGKRLRGQLLTTAGLFKESPITVAMIVDELPAVVRCAGPSCRRLNIVTAEGTGAVGLPRDVEYRGPGRGRQPRRGILLQMPRPE